MNTILLGCFNKDQVYLDGILRILRYRQSIDFCLLTALGKVGKPTCYIKPRFFFLTSVLVVDSEILKCTWRAEYRKFKKYWTS